MAPLLAIGLDNVGYIAMVVLGVGFLIFFHELGHFVAAKAAGVRVKAFAIGMGPRIFGWRRGDTDYKVCLLPIGGYVSMFGEVPGEGDPTDPGDLNNQSVGWRFVIFSGGVVMNLLFALIAFPLVFNAGVPFVAPVVGYVVPGSSAWETGLAPGDRIRRVNGKAVYSFDQLFMEGALSGDDGILLGVERGTAEFEVRIRPRFRRGHGLKTIGFGRAYEEVPVVRLAPGDGPGRRAGLRDGDRIVADFGRPPSPEAEAEIAWGQRLDPLKWVGRKRELRVERDGKELRFVVDPVSVTAGPARLGIALLETKVLGTRTLGDPALAAALAALGLEKGDIVTGVRAGNESRIVVRGTDIARILEQSAPGVALEVLRAGAGATERGPAPTKLLPVPAAFLGKEGAARFLRATAWGGDDISGHVYVQPGLAAAKIRLAPGDRILALGGHEVRNWSDIRARVREADGRPLTIRWQPRPARVDRPVPPAREAELRPERVATSDYGFTSVAAAKKEVYRVEGLTGSLGAGLACSVDTIRQLYVTLERILAGSVSADNLGGIITISRATYDYASEGWQRFLWFLAILSLNLAFINVLPIPVLDGGQLMFVLIEKIKGSPVSVRVMTYAQVLGIAMVLLLLIFVTFNDIRRLLHG